ncbi:MAG: M16 family metallopeptidase [Anaerolineae bacterium]
MYSLPITPERVVRQQLANGIVLLVCENQASASVAIEGQIVTGAQFEQPSQQGLANLTAMLLRRGSQQHSFQEMNQMLDNVGASLSISADDNYASISGHALAVDLPVLLDLLSEMLLSPAFDEIEFSKARGQLLTNLGMLNNDTGYRAGCAFSQAMYPANHPYARSSYGTSESVAALSIIDVQGFYKTLYHPATLVLVVVGAIHAEWVVQQVERLLGAWQVAIPRPQENIPMVETPMGTTIRRVELPEKSQVDLIWGVIGMPRTSPDYYAASMANLILGRLGMMGRLGGRIRDELGLAYYVSSHLQGGTGPIPWNIVAGVNPAQVELAVQEIIAEITRMRDYPISDDELADCRSFLNGSLPIHLETNGDIADQLLAIEEFNLGLDYLQRYPEIVNSIGKQDIQRVVSHYLTPDRYVLAMSGTFE